MFRKVILGMVRPTPKLNRLKSWRSLFYGITKKVAHFTGSTQSKTNKKHLRFSKTVFLLELKSSKYYEIKLL